MPSPKRLYVGNLPYDCCNQNALTQLFAPRKLIDAKVMLDRETGQPRGFCFVELDDESEARDAVDQLNGSDYGGRNIIVSVANDRPGRSNNSGGGDHGGGRGGGGRGRRDAW